MKEKSRDLWTWEGESEKERKTRKEGISEIHEGGIPEVRVATDGPDAQRSGKRVP